MRRRPEALELRLAWAGMRARPGGWWLLALGMALAAWLPVVAAGLHSEATAAAVRSAVNALPESSRSVLAVSSHDLRGGALTRTDHTVRDAFSAAALTSVQRSLTFRPLSLAGADVSVGALSDLGHAVRLTSGRLPQSCRPARCEVLALVGPGNTVHPRTATDRAAASLGLVVTGLGELSDQRLTGARLVSPASPLLLGSDPSALAGLTSLALFGRSTAWLGTLESGSLVSQGVPSFTRKLAVLADTVNLATGPLSVVWPVDPVTTAAARAEASAELFTVLGAGAGALQLGFCVVVAAGLRRRQLLTARQLLRRGASTAQVWLTTVTQPLLAVAVGTLAGAGVATVVVWARLRPVVPDPWPAAGRAAVSGLPTLVALGAAAVLVSVAVLRWPAAAERSTQLVLDMALLTLGLAIVLLISGAPGPLAAGLVALVAGTAGLLAGRLWRPVLGLLTRRRALGPVGRVAVLGARRRPLLATVTTGFVAAACCTLVFAGAYRGSLLQSAADQAAARVPLDVTVAPSAQVSAPLSVLDGRRIRAAAPGVALHPVVSSTVTAFAGSTRVKALPLTGIDPQALSVVDEFAAVTGSKLAPADLAARLTVARSSDQAAPVFPAGTSRVDLRVAGLTPDITVSLWLSTAEGMESRVLLSGSGPVLSADLERALGPSAQGVGSALTVRGLEIAESAAHLMHRQHAVGEGGTDRSLASGVLRLGAVSVDGHPMSWPWSSWASDQAQVSGASGTAVRVGYRLAEDRVVLQPGSTAGSARSPLPVAVDPDTASRAEPTGQFGVTVNGRTVPVRIVAVLPRMPALGSSFALADRSAVTALLDRAAPGTAVVSQVWISAPGQAAAAVRTSLESSAASAASLSYRSDVARSISADPVTIRTVTLVTLAGAVALMLAMVSLATMVRADRKESGADHFALELDGLSPLRLRAVLGARCLSILAVGVPIGTAGGLLLAALAVRLLVIGPGGAAVVPPLRLVLATPATVAVLAAALLAGLSAAGLAILTAFRDPLPRQPETDLL